MKPKRARQQPAARKGSALQIEIVSTPSNLAGDRTGGVLPWMREDEEETRRRQAVREASAAYARRGKKRYVNPHKARELTLEIEDALTLGTLELGVRYTCQQIEKLLDREISGGMEMLSLRVAEKTPFRLREVDKKTYVFEDRRRAAA